MGGNLRTSICRVSMPPALFVECGSETFRKPRLFILIGNVTPWAWSTGAPARLSVVPRLVRVSFAHPSGVLAYGAFHSASNLIGSVGGIDMSAVDVASGGILAIEPNTARAAHQ